ncbi:MAG: hypothetical protein CVU73_08375 [Deltaproteobacteria bacterium HGW-Deltaproteobacteria-8]|jgi:hypothetical protein|nr:MAG: hypothetical protein CVU73_08375 [Deltaproteobacteria bacterium HGW-Deltaproteobacteria-8]
MEKELRTAVSPAGLNLRRLLPLAALALVALVLWSCAPVQQTVGHMRRDAWSLEEPHSLIVKFMRFDYQIQPVGDVAGVKGWAYLDTSKVPAWARWVDSLVLTVYLSDPEGQVMAQDTRSFLPREASADEGVAFEFSLRPEQWGQRPLFVTFGYRVVLTEGRDVKGGKETFFASEDAITR